MRFNEEKITVNISADMVRKRYREREEFERDFSYLSKILKKQTFKKVINQVWETAFPESKEEGEH